MVKEKGAETIVGPVNPSTNETCGLLVKGFDKPPVVMMTYNPEYYITLLENAGFKKQTDLLAWYWDGQTTTINRYRCLTCCRSV
jgi:hypothetical protein